jgi:Protein of unknown function (DUF1566)
MRNIARSVLALCALVMGLGVSGMSRGANANGPYYATPSWDQTLPSSTRFIVLSNFNDAAVLDRETGLVWEKTLEVTTLSWSEAQNACISKNVGGRGGWKLPSIQELRSLMDPTVPFPGPALPAGHPFIGVQSSDSEPTPYWTSTTWGHDVSAAWFVDLDDGSAGILDKPQKAAYYWCVRGGSGVDVQ